MKKATKKRPVLKQASKKKIIRNSYPWEKRKDEIIVQCPDCLPIIKEMSESNEMKECIDFYVKELYGNNLDKINTYDLFWWMTVDLLLHADEEFVEEILTQEEKENKK